MAIKLRARTRTALLVLAALGFGSSGIVLLTFAAVLGGFR